MPPNQGAFMWVYWIGSLLSSILGTAAAAEGADGDRASKHFRHPHQLQMSCSKQTCPWTRSRRKATRRTLPLALPSLSIESGQGRKQRYSHPSLRAARSMRAASVVLFRQEDELGPMHQSKYHQVLLTMPRDHHPRGLACLLSTKSKILSGHSSHGLPRVFAFCTIGIPAYI